MRDFPPTMAAIRIRGDALSLREQAVAATRPLLRALFVAVLVVLAIACANVTPLVLRPVAPWFGPAGKRGCTPRAAPDRCCSPR
jgi:hypothetical protein